MKTKEILDYLEKKKVDFEAIDHKEVFTSKDEAKATKLNEKEIAKVLVLKANGKKFIMAVLPSNLAAKLKRIKSNLGAKEVILATEAEMKKTTGLKPGSAPALGKLLKMKVYADKTIEKSKNIVFPVGDYKKSAKMKTSDWLDLEKPEVLEFSVVPSGRKKSQRRKGSAGKAKTKKKCK